MNASKLCAVLLVGLFAVNLMERGTEAQVSPAQMTMMMPRYQISGGGPDSSSVLYVINTQTGRLWQVFPQQKKFIDVGTVPEQQ